MPPWVPSAPYAAGMYNLGMRTTTLPPDMEAAIWERVIPPDGTLDRSVARAVLKLGFSTADRERMHQLALRAQEGRLSPSEEGEIEGYERVGTLLSILKSKARKLLKAPKRSSR